jgi:Glycosyltransferase family 87
MRVPRHVRLVTDVRVMAALYAITALIASWQKYAHGHANNLRIFRASFWNLMAGRDLYSLQPALHADYFKYSPTFALLMAPFAALPELVSAMAWNFCNAFALFAAIRLLDLSREQKAIVLWLGFIELLTSIQNFQSNALVAALIIATFVAFERGWPEAAGLFVALGASIKIFGGAAALLFLFYPRKLRFIFTTGAATLMLIALPLLVTSPAQLLEQYRSWFALLQADYLATEKLSVMSWLHAWFGLSWPNSIVQVAGLIVLSLPLFRLAFYTERVFRLEFLASLLVFLVIFNHKAESPMFILAVSGVAIWYAVSKRNIAQTILVAFVLLITSLGSTDLVPHYWRATVTTPLVLKVVPCLVVWCVMQAELLSSRTNRSGIERYRGNDL